MQAVYQISFAPDSRLLVSGSKDSTLKVICFLNILFIDLLQVWNLSKITEKTNTAPVVDLPGHGDEVYSVDWSSDGQRVCSGSKDKLLRIWRRWIIDFWIPIFVDFAYFFNDNERVLFLIIYST